jgi:hypothetical protein
MVVVSVSQTLAVIIHGRLKEGIVSVNLMTGLKAPARTPRDGRNGSGLGCSLAARFILPPKLPPKIIQQFSPLGPQPLKSLGLQPTVALVLRESRYGDDYFGSV